MVQPELLYIFYKSASGMFLKKQIKVVPVIVKCLLQLGCSDRLKMETDIAVHFIKKCLFFILSV